MVLIYDEQSSSGLASMSQIYFIDFEASSLLPGNFPIEVAWVDQDGVGETYLIKPHSEWLEDGCRGWSPESEAVHGISLEMLLREGTPVEVVATRAARVLTAPNVILYADQPGWDGLWLDALFEFGGISARINVLDVKQSYKIACRPLENTLPSIDAPSRWTNEQRISTLVQEIITRVEEEEQRRPRQRHRALPDADGLWRRWSAVSASVARWLVTNYGPED